MPRFEGQCYQCAWEQRTWRGEEDTAEVLAVKSLVWFFRKWAVVLLSKRLWFRWQSHNELSTTRKWPIPKAGPGAKHSPNAMFWPLLGAFQVLSFSLTIAHHAHQGGSGEPGRTWETPCFPQRNQNSFQGLSHPCLPDKTKTNDSSILLGEEEHSYSSTHRGREGREGRQQGKEQGRVNRN